MSTALITSLDQFRDGRLEIQCVVVGASSKSEGVITAGAGNTLENVKAQMRGLEERNTAVETLKSQLTIGQNLDLTAVVIPPTKEEQDRIDFNNDINHLRKLDSFLALGLTIKTDRAALLDKIQTALAAHPEYEDL